KGEGKLSSLDIITLGLVVRDSLLAHKEARKEWHRPSDSLY
ncbi:MAG: hypothetical protein ACJAWV_003197, partial [Flammeovirgaceae bacterium]